MWLRNPIQEPWLHWALPWRAVSAQVNAWTLLLPTYSHQSLFPTAKRKDLHLQAHNFPAELEAATSCVSVLVRKMLRFEYVWEIIPFTQDAAKAPGLKSDP